MIVGVNNSGKALTSGVAGSTKGNKVAEALISGNASGLKSKSSTIPGKSGSAEGN